MTRNPRRDTRDWRRPARSELDEPRRLAFAALLAVETDDAYLNLTLSKLLGEARLPERDAAFATELAHGTARMQGQADAVLAACLDAPVAGLQPAVRVALRLGVQQLHHLRVPAHAAVATSVELTRASAGERPVRLVNAVLRRISSRSLDEWLDELAPGQTVADLAIRASHPAWIVEAFAERLRAAGADGDELADLLAADNAAPSVVLAVRPGLCRVEDLPHDRVRADPLSPYGARLLGGDPADLAAVRSGRAGVQDAGSQLAAMAAAAATVGGPDRRWLDLCAGPGGKSALLRGLAAERGAVLVSGERQPHRAELVARSLRAYPGTPLVVAADGIRPPWLPGTFDRVLVDAPCTGLGALRRRPEARWRRTPADLDDLAPLQLALLQAAIDAVRVGGVVTYVTCSPHRVETRDIVDAALDSRAGLVEQDARALFPPAAGDLGPGPHAQLWPHRHGTDAMFVAVLHRG